jgi:uncharacterized protein YecT (DUF1311 family)
MRSTITKCALLGVAILMLMPAASTANSPACAATLSPLECLLHTNNDLHALADKMNQAYEDRVVRLGDEEKRVFAGDQKGWLKRLHIACGLPSSGTATPAQIAHATSCLPERYQTRAATFKLQCEPGKETLKEMEKYPPDKMFAKIPADLTIDNRPQLFMMRELATVHSLPSSDSKVLYGLKPPHTGKIPKWLALCRVQGSEGEWWFVTGEGAGLSYLLEGPAEQAAGYEAEAKKGREEMALRRKQLQLNK